MNSLSVNGLFELSKQAKKNKDYELERNYLNQAFSLAPKNPKIINALIRNSRKVKNHSELKKWLTVLYELTPNGRILFELMNLEQREGNYKRVKEILIENERIDPNSQKIKKRIKKVDEKLSNAAPIPRSTFFLVSEEDCLLVQSAREIIYCENEFSVKYNQITSMVAGQPEEIILALIAELYVEESASLMAQNLVKKYKKNLNQEIDRKKIALANKLLELILNKKTKRFHWSDFWRNNSTILNSEPEPPKVLVKKNFESGEQHS